MESLERAKARDARRLSKSILDPVVVESVHDIKRIVNEFDPKRNPVTHDIELVTQLEADGGTYEVRASTKSKSKRDMLVEGLDIIKRHAQAANYAPDAEEVVINGKVMRSLPIGNGVDGMSWVDPLIKQWTGGFRVGTHICWDIDEYRYKYDIYAHKLTRVQQDATGTPPTGSVQSSG